MKQKGQAMVRIIADSTCDLPREETEALRVDIVPLTIHFGETSYLDGVDMTHAEFYRKLRGTDKLPTTSQANPAQFEDLFELGMKQGDEFLVVTISSLLSATFQSAAVAVKKFAPDRIHLIDSGSASLGTQLLIREAARLRDEGNLSAKQIAERILMLAPRLRIYALVDTLKYLKMGGRLSGGAALIGGFLGIKPIVEVKEGKVVSIGRVRAERSGLDALVEHFDADGPDLGYGVSFGHADDAPRMEKLIQAFGARLGKTRVFRSGLGSVIGTHTGPGVVGVAYIVKA